MGITARHAAFHGGPPAFADIVTEIERISLLPIIVKSQSSDFMYRFYATIAFACQPREHLAVMAYTPDAPGSWDRMLSTPGIDDLARRNPQVAKMVDRWAAAPRPDPSLAYVHTRGYISEEGTLHDVVALALESLGGTVTPPIPDHLRALATSALTPSALADRHRRNRRLWFAELLKVPARLMAAAFRRSFR